MPDHRERTCVHQYRAHLSNGDLLRFGDFELSATAPRTAVIEDVDWNTGVVTLEEGVGLIRALEGRWMPVGNELHGTLYRVEEVLDERRFSIGGQDARCGRLLPESWDAETRPLKTSNFSYFTRAGMHIADENRTILGRITDTPDWVTVDLGGKAPIDLAACLAHARQPAGAAPPYAKRLAARTPVGRKD